MVKKAKDMKKTCRDDQRSPAGITLLSLVITIIVLLILAGIAITTLLEDNGIIGKAKNATEKYKKAVTEEQKQLNNIYTTLSSNVENENEDINYLIDYINGLETRIEQLEKDENLLEKIYPIGSVYISENETNPSEFLGGEWETYAQGRTLIGSGTGTDSNGTSNIFIAKSIGGEYTHTLSINEMPKHSHYVAVGLDPGVISGHIEHRYHAEYSNTWTLMSNVGYGGTNVSETGGSIAHNNIQPYITVYMWKRIN